MCFDVIVLLFCLETNLSFVLFNTKFECVLMLLFCFGSRLFMGSQRGICHFRNDVFQICPSSVHVDRSGAMFKVVPLSVETLLSLSWGFLGDNMPFAMYHLIEGHMRGCPKIIFRS